MIEERRSLGSYERQLEQDKITVEGLKAVSNAVSGIAMGLGNLGLAGGVVLGAMLFQKDLRELKDNIVEMWPEGGSFFSPEWIAKWGRDPLDIIEEDTTQENNHAVNELGGSLAGKSVYETYSITITGQWAAYDWAVAHIISDHIDKYGPIMGWSPAFASEEEAHEDMIRRWHIRNPPPPRFLMLDEFDHQIGIRYTAAHQWYNRFLWNRLYRPERFDPRNDTTWMNYKVLDWAVCATYPVILNTFETGAQNMSNNPYSYRAPRYQKGINLIDTFAFWNENKPNPYREI